MTKYEFRVAYRRRNWAYQQVRIFQTEAPAHRLADKLRRPWRDLAPVAELTIERRAVGAWHESAVALTPPALHLIVTALSLIDGYQPPRGRR